MARKFFVGEAGCRGDSFSARKGPELPSGIKDVVEFGIEEGRSELEAQEPGFKAASKSSAVMSSAWLEMFKEVTSTTASCLAITSRKEGEGEGEGGGNAFKVEEVPMWLFGPAEKPPPPELALFIVVAA